MPLHPKARADFALAPVAAGIDLNLQALRDRSPHEIDERVALALNVETASGTVDDRRRWVVETATRGVETHGWEASITDDGTRLHLEGGSVTIDLGLSPSLSVYLETGA